MCTLIVLHGVVQDYPNVVLHSRYMPKATVEASPRLLEPRIWGPYDVASKGTWIAFNESGLLVAITNQETEWDEKPGRSRGLLALDLLRECDSVAEAQRKLTDPAVRPIYRRGNFLLADGREACHVVWDRETWVRELAPGGHVITTLTRFPGVDWSDRAKKWWPNVEKRLLRGEELLRGFKEGGIEEALGLLKTLSADHAAGRTPASICYHSEKDDYIQTSSTILAVGGDVQGSRTLYCAGSPCEKPYSEYLVAS